MARNYISIKFLHKQLAWPLIEAVVVDSGQRISHHGSGKEERTEKKNWAKVKYRVDDVEYEANVLDAHTPGVPGDFSVKRGSVGWLDKITAVAKELSYQPYPDGHILSVHYDPTHSGKCLIKRVTSFQYYSRITFNWIFFLLGCVIAFFTCYNCSTILDAFPK